MNRYLRVLLFCAGFFCLMPILEGAQPSVKSQYKSKYKQSLTDQEIAAQESKLISLVNQERRNHGLAALSTWNTLSYYARQHSQNMAAGSVDFGHTGFEARANSIQKKAACYSVGENVAYCYLIDDPLTKSIIMWMDSPHHCENILGDYKETGIGIAYDHEGRCYITQLFSKRRS